jgi:hypothetical protein
VTKTRLLPALALTGLAMLPAAPAHAGSDRAEVQNTVLISRALAGGLPNGASTNAVISGDRRWARAIAYESDASNLVPGDTNGFRDVFVVRRAGTFHNDGTQWFPGTTKRVSRPRRGGQANGPSWGAAIGGGFHHRPRCVAFLSSASNLVRGDTNGKVDAFVAKLNGRKVRRVSLPRGRQGTDDVTSVVVSGNCKRISFTTGGKVFTRFKPKKRRWRTKGLGFGSDPSYSTGIKSDLVFAATDGVRLSRDGRKRSGLIAPGGSNPAYNDIKCRVVTYERRVGGSTQVAWRYLGGDGGPRGAESVPCDALNKKGEQYASKRGSHLGNSDSRDPVIGNSGFYISYESDATNLGVNSLSRVGDFNTRPDSYLFTAVRDITLVQSVFEKAVPLPGGGYNPSMAFYANYILFDSPAPMGSPTGDHQIFMRYLGPV